MPSAAASAPRQKDPLCNSQPAPTSHAGQTFGKEQIYEAVFGYDGTADDTAITQHIKNIRAKLRTAGLVTPETVLKTVWGVGYLWNTADTNI